MKGYVYAIRSHLTEKVYVGSTQSPLSVRMAGHRADFKFFNSGKKNFVSSFEVIECGDAYIEALEVVEFNDKAELIARENHFIRTLDCVNRRIEGRTRAQWYVDNAAAICAKVNTYRVSHLEEISAKKKAYNKEHREEQAAYQKKYRAEHIEEKKKRDKQYYSEHAEAIIQRTKKWRTEHTATQLELAR